MEEDVFDGDFSREIRRAKFSEFARGGQLSSSFRAGGSGGGKGDESGEGGRSGLGRGRSGEGTVGVEGVGLGGESLGRRGSGNSSVVAKGLKCRLVEEGGFANHRTRRLGDLVNAEIGGVEIVARWRGRASRVERMSRWRHDLRGLLPGQFEEIRHGDFPLLEDDQ